MRIQIDSDCEGPISLNDNAFELCEAFLPSGGDFFTQISRYDDYLADIVKRPGYKGGDTLKLIIPFLLLFEVNKEKVLDFSRKNLILLDDYELIAEVQKYFPFFLISTSYSEYALSVAEKISIPKDNVYSTKVEWDSYCLSQKEKRLLKSYYDEILTLPFIEIPPNAGNLTDLTLDSQKAISRLEEIFWQEIINLSVGKIYSEVNTVGGLEKARALIDAQTRTGIPFENIIYFGDSITDKEALREVRKRGGLAVAVNANRYALEAAELAVLTSSVYPLVFISWLFSLGGKEKVLNFAGGRAEFSDFQLPSFLITKKEFKVVDLKGVSWQDFYVESETFRRQLRGKKIGGLG